MRRLFATLFVSLGLLVVSGISNAQAQYFPSKTFDNDTRLDRFVSSWYSNQLRALDEPSLLAYSKQPSTESYRFLWLRTFHHPVAVRIDIQPDGSSILTTKVADGAGGYAPGKLITNTTTALSKDDTQQAIVRIKNSGFWNLPAYNRDKAGTDGSEWVVEAVAHGRYHLVSEWSPKSGPIHEIGSMFLFNLAKLNIPKNEIY